MNQTAGQRQLQTKKAPTGPQRRPVSAPGTAQPQGVGFNPHTTELQPYPMQALQRTVGNRATRQLLERQSGSKRHSVTTEIQRCGDHACSCADESQVVQRDILDDVTEAASGALDTALGIIREIARLHQVTMQCQLSLMTLPIGVLSEIVTMLRGGRPADESILIENRSALEAICDCLPDVVVVWLARNVYLMGKPLAQAHVDHYLTGGGADYVEDVAAFLNSDAGARGALVEQINESGLRQGAAGRSFTDDAVIRQADYQNQDYRMAFGNICCPDATGEPPGYLRFTVLDSPAARAKNGPAGTSAQVRVVMHDHYAWHPEEARISQCIHEAFERRKAHGAADFLEVGEATLDLPIDPALIPR